MTIATAKNTPRNTYTATSSQTAFTIGFEFYAVADVKVFKNGTLMTYNASPSSNVTYKITGTASSSDDAYEFGAGGTVTFGAGLAADDIVVIVRDIIVERTTDFTPSGSFDITTLNTQLDTIISMIADTQQQTDRSVKLLDTDTVSATVTLPAKATRASKVASFDSSGNLETTITSTGLSALNDITSEIGLLGTSANVTAMGLLGTSAVVADMALLGTSAVVADMALLADSDVIADMAILATSDIVSDLNTLATSDIVSDINVLATSDIVSDLNTLATSAIVTDLSILATSDIVSDINVLATSDIVSDLNTLATSDFVSDLNTLASSTVVTNIATVASNVAGVNSFAARYRIGSSDPSSDNDAGDLAFNTTSNTLKFFDGSSYNAITSGIADNEVTTAKINADAVTGAKIADNAINSEHYTDGSIDTAHIADAQVTTAKIADNAVTLAKMASGTDGNVISFDASGNPVAVATGSAGQVLTSAGAGAPPTFADAAGGGFTPTTLSGTSQSLNVGSFNFFNGGTHGGNTTLSFASVPTNAQWKYTFKSGGDAYRLNRFIFHKHLAHKILESGDLAGVRDLKFHDSGTKMYILSATDHVIYQYALSTAFDVSTATYTSKTYALNTDKISGFDLKPDGSKLLFFAGQRLGDRKFHEVPLSTNFDLATAGTIVDDGTVFDQADAANFYGFHMKSDGTQIFMMGDGSGSTQSIFRYELSGAYDVTTAAYSSNTVNVSTISNTRAMTMSADLTRVFVADLDADYIFEFSISSAGDLTSTVAYVTSHNIPQEVSIPTIGGLAFADSGKKFYIGGPNVNGDVNQFRVGNPHTLTLPSAVGNRLSPRDNFVPDDQVTLEFFTTNGGTDVTIIGDDVT